MAKIKLQDIADEVGCSVATVSYVLNNNPKQKINPETKKKIIQVASIMGYQKNSAASALASGKCNLIGILAGKPTFALALAEQNKMIEKLVEALAISGYQTVLLPFILTKEVHNVDAIICINLSEEDFQTVCMNNYIPMIGLDTRVHEPWIFEVSSTFSGIKDRFLLDDYLLVTSDINSERIKDEIKGNNQEVIFASSFIQLDNLANRYKDKNIVVVGDELLSYLKDKNLKLTGFNPDLAKKANKVIYCLKYAISHAEINQHTFRLE